MRQSTIKHHKGFLENGGGGLFFIKSMRYYLLRQFAPMRVPQHKRDTRMKQKISQNTQHYTPIIFQNTEEKVSLLNKIFRSYHAPSLATMNDIDPSVISFMVSNDKTRNIANAMVRNAERKAKLNRSIEWKESTRDRNMFFMEPGDQYATSVEKYLVYLQNHFPEKLRKYFRVKKEEFEDGKHVLVLCKKTVPLKLLKRMSKKDTTINIDPFLKEVLVISDAKKIERLISDFYVLVDEYEDRVTYLMSECLKSLENFYKNQEDLCLKGKDALKTLFCVAKEAPEIACPFLINIGRHLAEMNQLELAFAALFAIRKKYPKAIVDLAHLLFREGESYLSFLNSGQEIFEINKKKFQFILTLLSDLNEEDFEDPETPFLLDLLEKTIRGLLSEDNEMWTKRDVPLSKLLGENISALDFLWNRSLALVNFSENEIDFLKKSTARRITLCQDNGRLAKGELSSLRRSANIEMDRENSDLRTKIRVEYEALNELSMELYEKIQGIELVSGDWKKVRVKERDVRQLKEYLNKRELCVFSEKLQANTNEGIDYSQLENELNIIVNNIIEEIAPYDFAPTQNFDGPSYNWNKILGILLNVTSITEIDIDDIEAKDDIVYALYEIISASENEEMVKSSDLLDKLQVTYAEAYVEGKEALMDMTGRIISELYEDAAIPTLERTESSGVFRLFIDYFRGISFNYPKDFLIKDEFRLDLQNVAQSNDHIGLDYSYLQDCYSGSSFIEAENKRTFLKL